MDSTRAQSRGFRTPERWNSVPVPERVSLRAVTNVDKQDDGCWISRYSAGSHGYSQIGWKDGGKRHMVLGHRATWVQSNGQVPLGMTLDHMCKMRKCVNPAHLRLLPNYENARRTMGRDWPMGYCPNGHPNSELIDTSRGGNATMRTCGICLKASQARYLERVASGAHVPVNIRPEICKHGHDMTENGAKQNRRGVWVCRSCRNESQKRYLLRKSAS